MTNSTIQVIVAHADLIICSAVRYAAVILCAVALLICVWMIKRLGV